MAVNKLVLAFVTLILGVALLSQIAVSANTATSKTIVRNESVTIIKNATDINTTYVYTLTNAPSGWKLTDCPITNFVLTNSSDNTAWTVTTDYTINAANGTFLLVNSSTARLTADNLTYANYKYCADDYLNSTWGRTTLNLVSGFFALALLLVSVALFYSVAKETGIV
jgi:hypothetical protein